MAGLRLTGMVFNGEPGGIWQGGGIHDWNCAGSHYRGGGYTACNHSQIVEAENIVKLSLPIAQSINEGVGQNGLVSEVISDINVRVGCFDTYQLQPTATNVQKI